MKTDFYIFGPNWEISVIVLSAISREIIRPLLIVVCLLSNFLWQQRVHKYITFPRLAIFELSIRLRTLKDKVDTYSLFKHHKIKEERIRPHLFELGAKITQHVS